MKALSFRQPWAELILQQRKTMDLRTYTTNYRGRLAIHASQKIEAQSAKTHQLNPDKLDHGGVVGTVELVDVIPLDEATYHQHEAAHLAGRQWREGLYGWLLADPQRLDFFPVNGRTNLFTITLPSEMTHPGIPTPDKPFALYLQPVEGDSTDYALTLRQRVVEPEKPDDIHLETITTLSGDNLKAVADHVMDALRQADYKVTDLSSTRRKPFYLPEDVGVRLGLVFLTVKPLTKIRRVEQISYGIRQMPSEEAYYWYSKCTATNTADRAQKALRVLLAAE